MTNRIKYIIFLVFISFFCQAQQLPHYSLYMYNDVAINPAVCGVFNNKTLTLAYRNQWVGFPGAPKTQLLSYEHNLSEKISLGGGVFSDVTGPISRIGAQLNYSYELQITDKYNLHLGLSTGFYEYVFDDNKMELYDDIFDPAAPGIVEKANIYDATFGIYMYNKNSHFGISVPHLIEDKININTPDGNTLVRHYFVYYRYNHSINKDFIIKPSILLKKTAVTPLQYDFNLQTNYGDSMWFGVSYRDRDALVFMLGINKDKYSIGYSYDITVSDLSNYQSGSHGIILKYRLSD